MEKFELAPQYNAERIVDGELDAVSALRVEQAIEEQQEERIKRDRQCQAAADHES